MHVHIMQVYESSDHFMAVFQSLAPLLSDIQLPDCEEDPVPLADQQQQQQQQHDLLNADVPEMTSSSISSSTSNPSAFDVGQTMKDVNRER